MSFPKVYTVNGPSSTSSASLPSWVTIKARPTRTSSGHKKRVKTQRESGQLESIQDFSFPSAAIKIRTTADGQHALGTGTYKPMIKCWDSGESTEKFTRVTDAENVDFVMLSTDWTKSLHLQRDRSLQLHTQGGLHHTVRLPIYGRALGYHSPSADALVACTGTEVFRFNLEEGRYMTPSNVASGWGNGMEDTVEGVNASDVNPVHGSWSFGLDGGGGVVEFWDPRSRTALTRLNLPATALSPAESDHNALYSAGTRLSVTSSKSHPTDGSSIAVGTSTGHTSSYDSRSPSPFAVKDQGYGESVRCVDWSRGGGQHEDSGRVISADSKVIKVWDKNEPARNHLSLHPPNPLVDLHCVPDSGSLFAACDASPINTYYIPDFGPAPRWASFLDNVTEEMADDPTSSTAYQDYKFVDRAELETLGLTHLIGTPASRPYMHGFFLALKSYQTARLIANPQSYAEHREKIVEERSAKKAESRIRAKREQPKVNKALAERSRKEQERLDAVEARKAAKRAERAAANGEAVEEEAAEGEGEGEGEGKKEKSRKDAVLLDPRFAEMFSNPDFEIDEGSKTFQLLNPATSHNARSRTAVEEEEDDSDRSSAGSSDEESEPESEPEQESEPEESDEDMDEDEEDEEQEDSGDGEEYSDASASEDEHEAKPKSAFPLARGARPKLQGATVSKPQTFGQRSHASRKPEKDEKPEGVLAMRRSADGGMEMSFIPKSGGSKGKLEDEDDEYGGGGYRRRSRVETFGAGLEKGGHEEEDEMQGRNGRTKRRHIERSASKNAFRRR